MTVRHLRIVRMARVAWAVARVLPRYVWLLARDRSPRFASTPADWNRVHEAAAREIEAHTRELLEALSRHFESHPYLLGARPDVLDAAVKMLMQRYPGLRLAGHHHGFFAAGDEPEIVARVRDSGADCLFLAIPTPAKERFLAAHADGLGVPFVMGIGGTLDDPPIERRELFLGCGRAGNDAVSPQHRELVPHADAAFGRNAVADIEIEIFAAEALRVGGLAALVALPVLLAVSLVLGKVVAMPAALFVPLLGVSRIVGKGERATAAAVGVLSLPLLAGLFLLTRPELAAVQPVSANCALLAAFAAVPFLWWLFGRRIGADGADRLQAAVATVEACAPDCAALGLNRDLVCVAATRAAAQMLGSPSFALIGQDAADLTTLFERPALIRALASARDSGDEVATSLVSPCGAAQDAQPAVFSARLQPLPCGLIMVLEPENERQPIDASLVTYEDRGMPTCIDRATDRTFVACGRSGPGSHAVEVPGLSQRRLAA